MSWTEIGEALREAAASTGWAGWAATITAILYVILAARENIFCWPFGVASSALSVMVYFESKLPFEGVLNIGYCLLGIYGWWEWRSRKRAGAAEESSLPVINVSLRTALLLAVAGIAGSLACGWISKHYNTSSLPWADSAITVFSIIATWMTAKKMIENWLLWVLIDAAAAIIYFIKGPELYLFGLLFIVYTFIAVAGYFAWKKTQKRSNA